MFPKEDVERDARAPSVACLTLTAAAYFAVGHGAMLWLVPRLGCPSEVLHLVETGVVALLSVVATWTVYRQRTASDRSRGEALERLHAAHAERVVSEVAASQVRIAAALSHELNTPLGALSSVNETLLNLIGSDRKVAIETEELAELDRASRAARERLRGTIARMERFTNLDRAAVREMDVNEVVGDAIVMSTPGLAVGLDIELGSLPPVRGQPQILAAAFTDVLQQASAALPNGSRVGVRTTTAAGAVKIELRSKSMVRDDRGELTTARYCVAEQGGTLDVVHSEDAGTAWRILLPVEKPRAVM